MASPSGNSQPIGRKGPVTTSSCPRSSYPPKPKPLEISVTPLPWGGTRDDLLRNVNRWRGQLQLPPTTARQLGEDTEEVKTGDQTITLVDLRGHFGGSGMSPPFAGAAAATGRDSGAASNLPAGHPPLDANPNRLPPGHPDIGATPPAEANEATPPMAEVPSPTFTAPADWRALPAGGLRKAAFVIGDEKHGALFTLINFPAREGPMIADPLQNVNRWRGEVGLPAVTQDELSNATESIEIDGQTADLCPSDSGGLQNPIQSR